MFGEVLKIYCFVAFFPYGGSYVLVYFILVSYHVFTKFGERLLPFCSQSSVLPPVFRERKV
jgi:hypothetical protein